MTVVSVNHSYVDKLLEGNQAVTSMSNHEQIERVIRDQEQAVLQKNTDDGDQRFA